MNILVNDKRCDYTYVYMVILNDFNVIISITKAYIYKPNDELVLFNICYFC